MIPINAIVELKGEAEDLYREATSPARARVKRFRVDEYGYDKVYVEWDKDHWRSQGESDRWTYASHFDVVSLPDDSYLEQDKYEEEDSTDKLKGALEAASKIACYGEGFVMITLERDPEGELYPKVIVSSTSDEAESLFEEEILPLLGFDHEG
jgi:hypothetical protein